VREGYELNCPVATAPGDGGTRSLFMVDAPNVILETVKPAEDGSGDVIIRLYESMRTSTRVRLSTSLDVESATRTNMLEEPEGALELAGGAVTLDLRPFEIATVRFALP
jgi:alpha-mannosidase